MNISIRITAIAFALAMLSSTSRLFGADDGSGQSGGTIAGAVTIDGKTDVKGFKLQEAVIYIQSKEPPAETVALKKRPEVAAVIDQKDKTYVPHVNVVPAGSIVEFHNSDTELHNIHSESTENPEFNIATVPGAQNTKRLFAKPEVVRITCNIHSDMLCYVVVCADPHFAMPNNAGLFEIKGVPPGNYIVTLWHEKFEEVKKDVTVKDGQKTELNFELERSQAIRRH